MEEDCQLLKQVKAELSWLKWGLGEGDGEEAGVGLPSPQHSSILQAP